jgi:hypothetical protein
MKKLVLIYSLLILTLSINSQSTFNYIDYKGDTTALEVNETPTVCDCENIDWRNNEQKKVCNLTYDYDFMSEEEQKEYDKQQQICQHPSICDCANVSKKNKGLLKTCNRLYNYKSISQEKLEKNIKRLQKCPENKKEEIKICDCINVDNYKLKKECNKLFFNDSLVSEEQRKTNLDAMKKCIEKQDYELNVSTCDCAKYGENDKEFKKICDKKIEKLKANKRELTEYLYDMEVCRETEIITQFLAQKKITIVDQKYTLCGCKKEDLEKSEIEKCNSIWDYDSMSIEQQKAYTSKLNRCR